MGLLSDCVGALHTGCVQHTYSSLQHDAMKTACILQSLLHRASVLPLAGLDGMHPSSAFLPDLQLPSHRTPLGMPEQAAAAADVRIVHSDGFVCAPTKHADPRPSCRPPDEGLRSRTRLGPSRAGVAPHTPQLGVCIMALAKPCCSTRHQS